MMRTALFDAVRPFGPGGRLSAANVPLIDALADAFGLPKAGGSSGPFDGRITLRIALELLSHEAIVREAYKDSVGVWTWAVGVTSASGHSVERYKDNPQTIERCLEIYVWLLTTRYAPAVLKAFDRRPLTEAQFGAALSFHYNTGAILKASWVQTWLSGDTARARLEFMSWRKPAEIIPRREKERDLFFDGTWSADGRVTVFPVRKPSYQPDFRKGERIDVHSALTAALAKAAT